MKKKTGTSSETASLAIRRARFSLRPILDKLKLMWRNWKVRGTGRAYRALTQAMRDDPDYAHTWKGNMAMPIFDGAKDKLTIGQVDAMAEKLMQHLLEIAEVSTTTKGKYEIPKKISSNRSRATPSRREKHG